MTYTRPPGEDALTGGCAFGNALCTWAGTSAYLWHPNGEWHSLSPAPTAIDSGFKLESGLLAGADTHVGFLPSGATDWAWWHDLSAFTDAHPMFGDLLLCPNADDGTYTLFSLSESGLDDRAHFEADDLAEPLAGWSPPNNPERILLLGTEGLWALDPPYTPSSLQPLVSFDNVALPAPEDISGPFHSGPATVIIPRRSRTALRLDLSDGSGHATGLKHLPGDAALWSTYLRDDRELATRLLSTLATLPPSDREDIRLHDVLVKDGSAQAVATSAGLICPDPPADPPPVTTLLSSPLDGAALATWGLWLEWDDAVTTACRRLCDAQEPDVALAESLHRFAGTTAGEILFEMLRSDPPASAGGEYDYPIAALRALAAACGDDAASLVEAHLTKASVPARRAACAMAGATLADAPSSDAVKSAAAPALWDETSEPSSASSVPTEALRANTHHDHPAVRAAARDTCNRLGIATRDEATESNSTPSNQARRSVQSSQPESPK